MNACFWQFRGQPFEDRPCLDFVLVVRRSRAAHPTQMFRRATDHNVLVSNLRHVVCSRPWTRILDVVVAGHVLRDKSDMVFVRLRKQVRCSETADTSSDPGQQSRVSGLLSSTRSHAEMTLTQ